MQARGSTAAHVQRVTSHTGLVQTQTTALLHALPIYLYPAPYKYIYTKTCWCDSHTAGAMQRREADHGMGFFWLRPAAGKGARLCSLTEPPGGW